MENQMHVQPTYPTIAYNHIQQQQPPQNLQNFWTQQRSDMETANDFKNHHLPLARIKKIMKADEDVRMISAEAPVLFAKACELFILELTVRSWLHAEENKRRTLQKNDIAAAITRTDIFDFLVDIVPREEIKEEAGAGGGAGSGAEAGESAAAGVPYYYSPAAAVGPGVMMGQPVMEPAAMFVQRGMVGQSRIPAGGGWQQMWQHGGLFDDESYGQP